MADRLIRNRPLRPLTLNSRVLAWMLGVLALIGLCFWVVQMLQVR